MLEYIFTGLALEADQIEPLHRRQPRLDTGLADRGGQQFRIETPSDDRCHLQQCAVLCREAVDARSEQTLHARRQRRSHRPDVEVQFAFRRADDAALRKKAHDFFGEQRIAFGLPRHLPCHRLGQALHPAAPAPGGERRRRATARVVSWSPSRGRPTAACIHADAW